jgi:hypothetical protein
VVSPVDATEVFPVVVSAESAELSLVEPVSSS